MCITVVFVFVNYYTSVLVFTETDLSADKREMSYFTVFIFAQMISRKTDDVLLYYSFTDFYTCTRNNNMGIHSYVGCDDMHIYNIICTPCILCTVVVNMWEMYIIKLFLYLLHNK